MRAIPRRLSTPLAALLLVCAVATGVISTAQAVDSSKTIAQSFQVSGTTKDFVAGAIVSTAPKDSKTVELANPRNTARLIGVIDNSPLLVISSAAAETRVVMSGSTSVLVSDVNGAIKTGDKIAVSPISGIGMKTETDSLIIGTAQSDFDPKKSESRQIKDYTGKTHTIRISTVLIQVGVSNYQTATSDLLPDSVQLFANNVAGRQVSVVRILVAGVLLLAGLAISSILVYTTVRGAVVSIGRNPLAAASIRKGIIQVILLSVIILAAMLLASYITLIV